MDYFISRLNYLGMYAFVASQIKMVLGLTESVLEIGMDVARRGWGARMGSTHPTLEIWTVHCIQVSRKLNTSTVREKRKYFYSLLLTKN